MLILESYFLKKQYDRLNLYITAKAVNLHTEHFYGLYSDSYEHLTLFSVV